MADLILVLVRTQENEEEGQNDCTSSKGCKTGGVNLLLLLNVWPTAVRAHGQRSKHFHGIYTHRQLMPTTHSVITWGGRGGRLTCHMRSKRFHLTVSQKYKPLEVESFCYVTLIYSNSLQMPVWPLNRLVRAYLHDFLWQTLFWVPTSLLKHTFFFL